MHTDIVLRVHSLSLQKQKETYGTVPASTPQPPTQSPRDRKCFAGWGNKRETWITLSPACIKLSSVYLHQTSTTVTFLVRSFTCVAVTQYDPLHRQERVGEGEREEGSKEGGREGRSRRRGRWMGRERWKRKETKKKEKREVRAPTTTPSHVLPARTTSSHIPYHAHAIVCIT